MRKWWKQFTTEWLILWRNWWLLLAVPGFAVWMGHDIVNSFSESSYNPYDFIYSFSYLGHTMTLGIAIMLGVLSVRRDTQPRVTEMVMTWPLGHGTWLTAKYTAIFSYVSLFSVAMVTVSVFAYNWRNVSLATAWDNILFLFIQYELSYAVTLALGMVLATWLRHRIVYLIAFCAWMFGTFFIDMFMIDRFGLPYLQTFHLSQLTRNALWSTDVWGASLVPDEIGRSRLFVILFTLSLLAAIVFTRYVRRPGKGRRASTYGLVFICSAMLVSGGWYGALWAERIGDSRQEAAMYPSWDDYFADDADEQNIATFPVDEYKLDVAKDGEKGLSVSASMILDPAHLQQLPQVSFTLNHRFRINGVYVNGQDVQFERDWDTLTIGSDAIPQADDDVTVQVDYAGDVYAYHYPRYFSAFVFRDQLFLPYSIAWYPLPGEQTLYIKEYGGVSSFPIESGINPGRTDVHLTLGGFSNHVYATLADEGGQIGQQTYSGQTDHGVTLIAGQLMDVEQHPVRVITSPANREEAEQFVHNWENSVIGYYETWLYDERDVPLDVYYLPLSKVDFNEQVLNNAWFVRQHPWSGLQSLTYYSAYNRHNLYGYLFGDMTLFSSGTEDVTAAVRGAYEYIYLREEWNISHEEAIEYVGPFDWEGEMTPEREVLDMVGAAIDEGKNAEVKQLLRKLHGTVSDYDSDTPGNAINISRNSSMTVSDYDSDTPNRRGQGIFLDDWMTMWKEHGFDE